VSGRVLLLLLLLAAFTTAASYLYTSDTQQTISDPGLADLEKRAEVHGWPWGFYAQVTEIVPLGEGQVAVMAYSEMRVEQLGQTFIAWVVGWLILAALLLIAVAPQRRRL
jgi:hypothetical protein